ncbi:amidohydrolase family protein [Achromobacter xylosoxidans]|uniref:amidohydrolase family protein n=1 Tax=Alcaligenes xylosoxydans xylosoxydans TaxID=85698 RepID=UPI003F76ED7D
MRCELSRREGRGVLPTSSEIIIVDSDIHCLEPTNLWLDRIDRRFRRSAPRPQRQKDVPGRLEVMGRPIPAKVDHPARKDDYRVREELCRSRFKSLGRIGVADDGTSPESMLEAMSIEGIDIGIVYRTDASHAIAHDDMDPSLAAAICRAFNDWLKDFCDRSEKLYSTAIVSLHDIDMAVVELRRAKTVLGAKAIVLPSNPVMGRNLCHPSYDAIWREAQELDVAIAIHGIQLAHQEHLGNRYIDNFALMHAAAHPVELMLALGSMLTGGVFVKFPALKVGFLEGRCSWLPFWLDTLDDRWMKFGNVSRYRLRQLPSEYFSTNCFVSIDPDERLLEDVVARAGSRNLLFASDWPHHDSLYPQATKSFAAQTISQSDRANIFGVNALRYYGISAPKLG